MAEGPVPVVAGVPTHPDGPRRHDDGSHGLVAAAEPETVDTAHDLLDAFLQEHGVDDLVRIRFATAVVEILGNIVEHAFVADDGSEVGEPGSRLLEVVLRATTDEVVAHLSDNGLPAALDLAAVTMPDADAETGRGLALAVRALDDLRHERREGRNHWFLTCRLP